MSGALDGLLVADFSRVLAGPYATMLLADLGATVVKVERPGAGDDTRSWGPPWHERADGSRESTYFLGVNRNKRSVALNLSDTAPGGDLELAAELARRADVLVENFKPGTLTRLGLGYEQVAATNPGIVYASISGFGSGEGASLPGYDLLVQAVGGLMSITGPGPGEPTRTGVALVDVVTGLHTTVGILAALAERNRSGRGQLVSTNLLSSLLSALVNQTSAYVVAGDVPGIIGNRHPSITPYQVYQAADRPMVLAVGNDSQFVSFCATVGHPEWGTDERFASNEVRVVNRELLNQLVEPLLATRSADEWFQLLAPAGVPAGPVNGIPAAVALATSLGLQPVRLLAGANGPLPTVASPLGLGRTPVDYRSVPPRLDEQGDDVRDWLRTG